MSESRSSEQMVAEFQTDGAAVLMKGVFTSLEPIDAPANIYI